MFILNGHRSGKFRYVYFFFAVKTTFWMKSMGIGRPNLWVSYFEWSNAWFKIRYSFGMPSSIQPINCNDLKEVDCESCRNFKTNPCDYERDNSQDVGQISKIYIQYSNPGIREVHLSELLGANFRTFITK